MVKKGFVPVCTGYMALKNWLIMVKRYSKEIGSAMVDDVWFDEASA